MYDPPIAQRPTVLFYYSERIAGKLGNKCRENTKSAALLLTP